MTWYTKVAEAGHATAMYGLGLLHDQQGDVPGAVTWYTKAADVGCRRDSHPRCPATAA
jgi:TPR repeat protein